VLDKALSFLVKNRVTPTLDQVASFFQRMSADVGDGIHTDVGTAGAQYRSIPDLLLSFTRFDVLDVAWVPCSSSSGGGGSSSRSGPRENEREVQRRRVRGLTRISAPQLDAFELGEVAMAKTFTGNSRAVNLAKEQGVYLEVFVFRAIWLVGV